MTTPPPLAEASERERKLNELIAAFLEADQSGKAGDRGDWLQRHPELADDLRRFFEQHDRLARLADPLRAAVPAPTTDGGAITSSPRTPDDVVPEASGSFGDYELLEEIARGGMGVVYRARQKSLNRVVALKMILAGQLASAPDVARFRAEAEAVAALEHPNLLPIYEVGEHGGRHFFAMKLIGEGSLADRVEKLRQTPGEAARLVARVARAVDFAHQRGILHRDLKPSNVLLDERGEPCVVDFGLAKKIGTDSGLTQSGAVVGTPSYMAPEQAAARKGLTVAVDIYALGAILYELLTGRPPFRGSNVLETLRRVVEAEPAPPRSLNPKVPRDLETICLKCLEKEPERRYKSAQGLADDLERFGRGEPVAVRPVGRLERGWKWCRRHPWQAGLGVASALLVLLLVGGSVALFFYSRVRGLNTQLQEALDDSERLRQEAERRKAEAEGVGRELKKKNVEIEKQNAEIEKQKELVLRALYGSQIKFADLAWQQNRMADLRRLLERYRPKPGDDPNKTLRRFEWDSLLRLYEGDLPTLTGLQKAAQGVCFSPDGTRLASACRDGTVKVWDARTGKEEALDLKGHKGNATSVCFSPDGTLLASASWGNVKVWDAGTGREVRTLEPADWFTSVCFSPDGKRLAAAIGDRSKAFQPGEVKVWEVRTGREEFSLKGHKGPVNCVCWSPDGTRLASAGDDFTVKVWDARTGQEQRSLKGEGLAVHSVCWSPDGTLLASGDNIQTVAVWDARTGQQVGALKGPLGFVTSVCFSPDGTRLACASDGDFLPGDQPGVKVWDLRTGRESHSLKGHTCVCFSPDGTRLASAGDDRTVKLWDACIGQEALALNGHAGWVHSVCFSPDGTCLASAGEDGTVKLWDPRTGEEARILKGHTGEVYSVCWSPDGKRLASASGDHKAKTGEVKVWEVRTGREELSLKGLKGSVHRVCWSPDGKRIATASDDGGVKVWDADTGQEALSLKGHTNGFTYAAFSPDGTRLACAGMGGVKLWDARTGQEQPPLKGETALVNSVCWSPDGQRLATASSLGTVQVWDAVTGQKVLTLDGHIGQVHRVCWSPDGARLASAGGDMREMKVAIEPSTGQLRSTKAGPGTNGEVKVWDAATGQELRSLKAPPGAVALSVCFAPDDNRLASGDAEGRVRIWEGKRDPKDIEPRWRVWQRQQAKACEQAGAWFAAAFHLRQALKEAPDDKTLETRLALALGNLHAERGQWAEAVVDFEKARQLQPHQLAVESQLAFALLGRANASARAAAAASRTLGALSAPFNYSPLAAAAPFPWQGDLSDYRRLCAELLHDFGQTADADTADGVAFLCVLCPQAVKDPALSVQLARKAVDSDPDNLNYRETLGAALYRAGDFDAAVRELKFVVEKDRKGGSVEAELLLAMAHHQLKHPKAVKDWYAKAAEQIRRVSGSPPWEVRLCWQLLGDETEALLQAAPQP
jgi:eukaryotic-like serine/threonine-protein kinase